MVETAFLGFVSPVVLPALLLNPERAIFSSGAAPVFRLMKTTRGRIGVCPTKTRRLLRLVSHVPLNRALHQFAAVLEQQLLFDMGLIRLHGLDAEV